MTARYRNEEENEEIKKTDREIKLLGAKAQRKGIENKRFRLKLAKKDKAMGKLLEKLVVQDGQLEELKDCNKTHSLQRGVRGIRLKISRTS